MQKVPSIKMKIPRLIARILSAIIVVFALIIFIGETMESNKRGTSEPMTRYAMLGLILFGIGLLGLAIAWKWEMAGGIISFLAFTLLLIALPSALLLPMFIFPANAIHLL